MYYIDLGGARQMLGLLLVGVDLVLLLDLHLVRRHSVLYVLRVELLDHPVDVFVVGQGYLGQQHPVLDVVHVEVLRFTTTVEVGSAGRVGEGLQVFVGGIVVS